MIERLRQKKISQRQRAQTDRQKKKTTGGGRDTEAGGDVAASASVARAWLLGLRKRAHLLSVT